MFIERSEKMIIDLSHRIEEGMPVYPGTKGPAIKTAADYEEAGFREIQMQILTHTGTHLDCPAHIHADGLSVERLPLEQFYGPGLLVDCSRLGRNGIIDLDMINRLQKEMVNKEFILFYTAWDQYWGSPDYFQAYPTFSQEAIHLLVRMKIKGIGIDTVSIDPVETNQYENHRAFLQGKKIIIENLRGLAQLVNKEFEFICFPLMIKGGDGSPTRAAALLK